MKTIVAETHFDCIARDGEEFHAKLYIGDIQQIQLENGQIDSQVSVTFTPLFAMRKVRGVDSFQALCLSVELVRDALRAFSIHGGLVYFPGTRSPINIESPTFAVFSEPIDGRYLGSR